jgi:hypothetical protein
MRDDKGTFYAAIHPGQINITYEPFVRGRRSRPSPDPFTDPEPVQSRRPVQFENNSHEGKISKVAARKIGRAVDYLTYLVPKKKYFQAPHGGSGNYFLTFITITLSSKQIHGDNEIKRSILEPFLNELRKRYKVRSYIWRAERQENGNIHFHILADRFIWWNDLRNSWNYFQERLGYVSRYRDAMREFFREGFRPSQNSQDKRSISEQYNAWRKNVQTDWASPNSTDIHSLKTIVSVRNYVRKYITKDDDQDPIKGRLWGCSGNLSNLSGAVEFASGSVSEDLNKLMKAPGVKIYKSDYFTVIYFDMLLLISLCLDHLLDAWCEYLARSQPEYYTPELRLAA